MTTLLALLLPFAGCAAMMIVCSRMTRRGDCATDTTATDIDGTEVALLRAEVAELRARLETTPDQNDLPAR